MLTPLLLLIHRAVARRLNHSLAALLWLGWLGTPLLAAEYTFTNNYYGTPYTNRIFFDDSFVPGQLKGVIVTFNYGATVYANTAWRNFAKDRGLALLLLLNQDTLGIPAYVPDGTNILSVTLASIANASGHAELAGSTLPLIFLGVSRGGTSGAVNFGWAMGANRTVACLSYHGNSFNYLSAPTTTAAKNIPVLYPMAQLDSGPYRQTDIETAVRTTATTTLNGSISATAYGLRPTAGLYWTTTMQYGSSHASTGDDTYPLQWLGRVWDARYNGATPGTLNAITNAASLAGSYALVNGASSTAFFSNTATLAFAQKDTNVWVPPGGGAEWLAASGPPQTGVPLNIDSAANTSYTAPANILNRNFIHGGTVTFTGAGVIGLDNSGGGNPDFFQMTGGTLSLQHGVTLRNGGNQGGVWTNNRAALALDATATFDLWNGNPVFLDALTGAGTVTIANTSGVNWAGARSLTVGVNNGSGIFTGVIGGNALTDGGAISVTKVGAGVQTLNGACRFSGKTAVQAGTLALGGTLEGTAVVEVFSNATLQLNGGAITNGTVQIDAGGALVGYGSITAPVVNTGTILVTNGTMRLTGNVTNYGTVRLTGGALLAATNGTFVNNGVLDIITGNPTLPAHFVNNGVVLTAQQARVAWVVKLGNAFQLGVQGYPGHNYLLLRALNLAPGANWTVVGSAQPGTGGMLTFTDPGPGSNAAAYYRIQVAP